MAKKKGAGCVPFSNKLGIFLVILYTLCFFWYFVNPSGQELHLKLFRMMFLGFEEMNAYYYWFGAVQVFVWAWIVGYFWHWVMACEEK